MGDFSSDEINRAGRKRYRKDWIGDLSPTEEWLLRGVSGQTRVPNPALEGQYTTIFHRGEWKNKSLQARREVAAGREIEMWAQWQAAVDFLRTERPGEQHTKTMMRNADLESHADAYVVAGGQSQNDFYARMRGKGVTRPRANQAVLNALFKAGISPLSGRPAKTIPRI